MSRLPIPGGDNGNWGAILNDYLSREHNADGSLKIRDEGIPAAIADGSITASKLSSSLNSYIANAQTAVQSVNGKTGQSVTLAAADISDVVANAEKGAANGVATLDGTSKLTTAQLPSSVVKTTDKDVASGVAALTANRRLNPVTAPIPTSDKIKEMGRRGLPVTIVGGINNTNADATVTCTSTVGLAAGMELEATGIPQGTKILSITDGTTFEMTATATSTGTGRGCRAWKVKTTDIPTITNNSSSAIASSAIQNTAATLSGKYRLSAKYVNNQTGSVKWLAGPTWVGACTLNGTTNVTVNSTAGLSPGIPITGAGIPNGTTIASVTNGTTFVLSAAATTSGASTLTSQSLNAQGHRLEFDFNGDEFELRINPQKYRIWVDEEPVQMVPVSYAPGVLVYLKFAFGTAKNRRICFEFEGTYPQFYGVYCHPKWQVMPPSIPSPMVIGVGDSFINGTGSTYAVDDYFVGMCRLVGLAHICTSQTAAGATGFVTANTTGTIKSYVDRIADTKEMIELAYAQDRLPLLILQCTLNDAGSGKAGTVGPAIVAYIASVRADYPDCPIVLMGPPYPKTPNADMLTLDTECAAAAVTAGVPYVNTLKAFSNPTSYLFDGTGNIGSPAGDGCADIFCASDGAHPSPDGHRFGLPIAYAPLLAQALGVDY